MTRVSSNVDAKTLISNLNPIITGWGNYYHHVVSKHTFAIIRHYVWTWTTIWCANKHPKYAKDRWIKKYYKMEKQDRWTFYDKESNHCIAEMDSIPIKRFIKVRSDKRVYDVNAKEYWDKREYTNAIDSIYGSPTLTKLFRRQQGKCEYCEQPFTDTQVKETTIHKHHMKLKSEGGDWKPNNLRLLHADCHTSLHSMYSRKDMADLIDKGIDYLRLMKLPSQKEINSKSQSPKNKSNKPNGLNKS